MKIPSRPIVRPLVFALTALSVAVGAALAVVITLPYSTHFAPAEGYSTGPLPTNGDWRASVGATAEIVPDPSGTKQALSFSGGGWLTLPAQPDPSPSVVWVDYHYDPVFISPNALAAITIVPRDAGLAFVATDAAHGEIYALNSTRAGFVPRTIKPKPMNLPEDTCNMVAAAIHDHKYNMDQAEATRQLIDQGDAAKIVLSLVEIERNDSVSNEAAIERTMVLLQSMGSYDYALACILMAHLWPLANELYLHQECDSIALWICDPIRPNLDLASYLESLAARERDPDLKRIREGWLKVIRSNILKGS